VRKPGNQDFIRVHPDITYRDSFAAIELKNEQRELYIVAGNMTADLSAETVPATLFTAIKRQGIVFFWPVRLPGSDCKINPWWRSAREAGCSSAAGTVLGQYRGRRLQTGCCRSRVAAEWPLEPRPAD
jgi:hypothetical protein